jgi:putative ABC transport system permease protein
MKIFRYFGVAVNSIIAHKMRAALTMLGIIIGVAAVLLTMGFGSGAAADITESIESGGTNLLSVTSGASGSNGGESLLTLADAEALADPVIYPDIALVAPQYSGTATFTRGETDGAYQVVGTTADYADVTSLDIEFGRFFTPDETAASERVVVLGATVAEDLFGNDDPIGQTVRIDNNLFQVIGVLEESGGGGFGSNDTQTYVPLDVALGRLFNVERYRGSYRLSGISIQVIDSERLDTAELIIEQTLRLNHGLAANDENDFAIMNQADTLEMVGDVTTTLTILLGSVGSISLLVGGIGIMNIMLVSVTERTREIGLRKAVGAHNSDILLQFLVEALMLCLLGGLIGIGISYGLATLLGGMAFMPFSIVIEPWSLALALGVSTASGFVFGLYPAWRATQLDPIEALRFE